MRLFLKKSETYITKIAVRDIFGLLSSSTVFRLARNLTVHFSTARGRSASW
jgi:hypothetical protein